MKFNFYERDYDAKRLRHHENDFGDIVVILILVD